MPTLVEIRLEGDVKVQTKIPVPVAQELRVLHPTTFLGPEFGKLWPYAEHEVLSAYATCRTLYEQPSVWEPV